MSDLLEALESFEGKRQRLAREEYVNLGFSIVGVGSKPIGVYARYIHRSLNDGIPVIHLLAKGYVRVATAQRLALALVAKGRLSVFRRDIVDEEFQGQVIPAAVITLVVTRLLSETRESIWNPREVEEWETLASRYAGESDERLSERLTAVRGLIVGLETRSAAQ